MKEKAPCNSKSGLLGSFTTITPLDNKGRGPIEAAHHANTFIACDRVISPMECYTDLTLT
jgi:hypothetical protein